MNSTNLRFIPSDEGAHEARFTSEQPARLRSVLVVEDEADVASMILMLLNGNGYNAVVAKNGADGWNLYRHGTWDLVVSDIHLTDFPGTELCRRIRKSAQGDRVPILLISGKVHEFEAKATMDLGRIDFLIKPFHVDIFYLKVRTLVRLFPVKGSASS